MNGSGGADDRDLVTPKVLGARIERRAVRNTSFELGRAAEHKDVLDFLEMFESFGDDSSPPIEELIEDIKSCRHRKEQDNE